MRTTPTFALLAMAALAAACDEPIPTAPAADALALARVAGTGSFRFEPITPRVDLDACLDPATPQDQPFQLPTGFAQTIIGRQSDLATSSAEVNFDMLTLNETGPARRPLPVPHA